MDKNTSGMIFGGILTWLLASVVLYALILEYQKQNVLLYAPTLTVNNYKDLEVNNWLVVEAVIPEEIPLLKTTPSYVMACKQKYDEDNGWELDELFIQNLQLSLRHRDQQLPLTLQFESSFPFSNYFSLQDPRCPVVGIIKPINKSERWLGYTPGRQITLLSRLKQRDPNILQVDLHTLGARDHLLRANAQRRQVFWIFFSVAFSGGLIITFVGGIKLWQNLKTS